SSFVDPTSDMFRPDWVTAERVGVVGGCIMGLSVLLFLYALARTLLAASSEQAADSFALPQAAAYHDEPALAVRNFRPWVIAGIVAILISYVPPLIQVLGGDYRVVSGSPRPRAAAAGAGGDAAAGAALDTADAPPSDLHPLQRELPVDRDPAEGRAVSRHPPLVRRSRHRRGSARLPGAIRPSARVGPGPLQRSGRHAEVIGFTRLSRHAQRRRVRPPERDVRVFPQGCLGGDAHRHLVRPAGRARARARGR